MATEINYGNVQKNVTVSFGLSDLSVSQRIKLFVDIGRSLGVWEAFRGEGQAIYDYLNEMDRVINSKGRVQP